MASVSFEPYQWGDIEGVDLELLSTMSPLPEAEIVQYLNELVRDGDVIHNARAGFVKLIMNTPK